MLGGACAGQSTQPAEPTPGPIAAELRWFAARAEALRQGVENVVDFYDPEVTLDHRALGPKVVRGEEDALALLDRRWSRDMIVRTVQGDAFVSVDAALTHEFLDVGRAGHTQQVAIRTQFGQDGATAESLALSVLSWRRDDPGDRRPLAVDVLARAYEGAWARGDGTDLRGLYAEGAQIEDSLLGLRASAEDFAELARRGPAAGSLAGTELMLLPEFGGPGLFATGGRLDSDQLDGVALLLTTPPEAQCVRTTAVWLALDEDGRIESESRYHRLGDLTRCDPGLDLPTGWWQTMPVPDPIRTARTGTIEVAGQEIEVYNGSPDLTALITWGFDRMTSAGLSAPTVERITFYPAHIDRCDGITGLIAREAIVLCFADAPSCGSGDCADGPSWKRATLLHELGHAWLAQNLSEDAQAEFLQRSGLRTWTKGSTWGERGVELAAETLAWGLMDGPYRVRRGLGPWSCADLTDLYETLTGSPPGRALDCEEGT